MDDAHQLRVPTHPRGTPPPTQTLHTSLVLVDNFFQTVPHLAKADFQLAGAAALYIAAKLEEFQPLSAKELTRSTKERYTEEEIKGMEMRMCKVPPLQLRV